MGTESGAVRATGRPRDPRIEQAALAAVRDLLAAGGYAAVTVAAVAERAGTTKAALYRRWPALPHLVHEAAFPGELALDLRLGADLATDLGGVVRGTRDALCSPVAAAALPALLAEIATWPDLHAAMMQRFAGVFRALDDRLRTAVEAGEAHPDTRADDLLRLVIGAVLSGVMLTPGQLDDAWVDRLTATLARSVRP
ncbi:TetR family transcriptional regulator [Nocardioides albidus]|uniref:TetR family transcriptional regulator n=1 Tax=Nocardioides albidus TaxID=1517589 RepID=A0A5C4VYA2_9ACTN|nr:TetR-like C-terminal domain-containing protein [Nocardioides albidus]TNM40346.1 TetR family transcriptional regulator [Nocardioides albidus]